MITEKATEMDKLTQQLHDGVGKLKPALTKIGKLQEGVKFLNEQVAAEDIVIYINGYGGYDEAEGEWVKRNLPVNKKDFIEFLKNQMKKALGATNKLIDELDITVDLMEKEKKDTTA